MAPVVRIAVVFGGQNTEHAVSLKSAASVLQNLDRDRYEVVPVRITVEGEWIVGRDQAGATLDESALLAMVPDRTVPLNPARSMVEALGPVGQVDVAFPVLHGPYGEDGTVQSVFELTGVPYVGNGVLASATSIDKEFTRKILAADGVAVARGVTLHAGQDLTAAQRDSLGLPVFVKPNRGGSRIGVSRVRDWRGLDAAMAEARLCDTKVLVEAAVAGREIDIGVLEMPDGRLAASPPLEIRVGAEHGFLDFHTDDVVPADLAPAPTERLQQEAMRVFRALGCTGLLRVNFFLGEDGTLTVNEVHTMPGLTTLSRFPRMWRAAGTAYPDLLDLLIRTALVGADRRAGLAPPR